VVDDEISPTKNLQDSTNIDWYNLHGKPNFIMNLLLYGGQYFTQLVNSSISILYATIVLENTS